GSTYGDFQCVHTRSCHTVSTMASAASLGHSADHTRQTNGGLAATTRSRSSSPASSAFSTPESTTPLASPAPLVSTTMTAHLLAQRIGDPACHARHFGRLDTTGPLDVHRELGRHPAGPAGEEHDAIAEPGGFTRVVGDEQHREAAVAPDALQLVVQDV